MSNNEQQKTFFIHSRQFWTNGKWLTSKAMKKQKGNNKQPKTTKSSKKQRKATKSKNGHCSWKNQNEQQRATKHIFHSHFIHSSQFWTNGKWLTSKAMKKQKGNNKQPKTTKSSIKQQRATKSKNGDWSWKNQNGQ